MNKQEQKSNKFDRAKAGKRETHINCKYCGSTHEPQTCPLYGRNLFKVWKAEPLQAKYAETRANRYQKRTKDAEQSMMCAKMMRKKRWHCRNFTW